MPNRAVIAVAHRKTQHKALQSGALIACFEKIGSEWLEQEFRHTVMAFGGGALLSAVVLALACWA